MCIFERPSDACPQGRLDRPLETADAECWRCQDLAVSDLSTLIV